MYYTGITRHGVDEWEQYIIRGLSDMGVDEWERILYRDYQTWDECEHACSILCRDYQTWGLMSVDIPVVYYAGITRHVG